MDRLTYINARGASVEFSAESDYRWLSVDDLGGVEAVQQTATSPYQDGTTPVGDPYFQPRVLTVRLAVIGEDVNGMLRTLNAVLNPKLGLGQLVYEVGGMRRSLDKVKVRQLPTLPDGGNRTKRVQITQILFEAFDPLYSDGQDTEVDIGGSGLSLSFPLDITEGFAFDYENSEGLQVVNGGDVETPITVVIDGPVTAPLVVENVTKGEKIVVQLDLIAGERLTIRTGITDIDVTFEDIEGGFTETAFQYIDISATTFFQLALGVNLIKVTESGVQASAASLAYRQRYVGV